MKILHLEDSPRDAELVRDLLESEHDKCEIIQVSTRDAFLQALEQGAYDVILSDFNLPGFNGLEALQLVRERGTETPFIFCSGTIGEEKALEAVRLGASDYIIKDRMQRLPVAIRNAVEESETRRSRRRAEESLRLFRTLVDRSNDAFEVIDPVTGRFLDVSERACLELGYSREEMLKLHVSDIDPLIGPEKWAEIVADKQRAERFVNLESMHRRKDGTTYPVELTIRLVPLDRDYMVVVVRDITERKKAEAELRLRGSALESAANAIVIIDQTGRIEWVNSAFCALTGYTAEEARGQDPNQLLESGRHDEAFYRQIWDTIRAGRAWKSEVVNRRKDGTLYSEYQTITPVPDASGHISHFVAIKEDITERKLAEQRIREQAEIIDHAPVAILLSDLQHRITYCNRGTLGFLGLKQEEIIGHTAEDFLQPETMELFVPARTEALAKGQWTGEVPLATKHGKLIHAVFHMLLIRDAEGRPRARLSIAIDITEKKKLEEQFLRAQRLESLGMLAAGIAHDLNNVLAPVIMAAPLLKSRTTNPTDIHVLNTIEHSAGRGAALVKQILSFAHGAAGGGKLLVQPKHLLRDITGLMEQTFPKTVELELDIPGDLWTVQGNPTQLHQILLNLCVNARDAMPKGGVLRLRAENRLLDEASAAALPDCSQAGPYLVLEVSDTGTGIPPDILARIWEPFFTTKGEGKGTGLGLSTVRGIAANHGGFVTVESVVGRGTTFRVFLPAAEAGTDTPDKRSSHPFEAPGGSELVLLVDDEASIRDLGTAILTRFGYRVITAENGLRALEICAAQTEEIALVLTDLGMPEMGGMELAAALDSRKFKAKVLFMTGGNSRTSFGAPRIPEGLQVLHKPFTVDNLLATIRQALAQPA